jgi:hypothetical protein
MKTLGKTIQALTFLGMLLGMFLLLGGGLPGAGLMLVLLCLVGYGFGRFAMMLGS